MLGVLVLEQQTGATPSTDRSTTTPPATTPTTTSQTREQTTPTTTQQRTTTRTTTQQTTEPSQAVTVAFLADGGMTEESRAVLDLIHDEGADVLVHSGDFDYQQDPDEFSAMLNATLGPDFPVVPAIGNHDIYTWAGYQSHLRDRVNRSEELRCSGDLGLESTCTYKSLTVVSTSDEVCSIPSGDDEKYPAACGDYESYHPEQYIREKFDETGTTWRVCSWHYPSHDYQVGDKSGVPPPAYDTCRAAGAQFVATGHNHAYARTYPMTSFENHRIGATTPPYTLGNGQTMALVTGASGRSFYETTDMVDAEWWAYTHTDGAFGAFFCTLRPDGTGTCYFKTIDGEIIDGPFNVTTTRTGT